MQIWHIKETFCGNHIWNVFFQLSLYLIKFLTKTKIKVSKV